MKENYLKIFDEYVASYEVNSKVLLKKEHIKRVADLSEQIAINIGLNENDINTAYLIGLFHDLGRFREIALTNAFSDDIASMDHAKMSTDILFKEGLINKFIDNSDYDDIIYKAVFYHNKEKVDENLTKREKLFADIIRDADKVDILNVATFEDMNDVFWYPEFENLDITDSILKDHMSFKRIDYKEINNNFDIAIAFYNYAYDINFSYTKKLILKDELYQKVTERFKKYFKKEHILNQILEVTLAYLKK